MPGPLDIRKLFDLDDLSPLDKLIQTIDDLDKGYTQIVKNAETNSDKFAKALQEVVDEAIKLEKSVQGLDSSLKENQKVIGAAASDVIKLTNAQEQLKKAQESQNAILVEAKTQQNKLAAARKEATKATLEDRIAQQEATKIAKAQIRVQRAQEGSIEQMRAKLILAKIEWANLSQEQRENTIAGQKLEKELNDLNEELKELESNVGITGRSVGDYTNAILEAAQQMQPLQFGTQGFGSALSGVVGSIPQLAALGAVVGGVASAMDQLQELTEEVKKQMKEVSDLTGETGDNLTNLTAGIRATSGLFEKEFNEVLRAGNVLSKEFGISQQEALDLINEGLVRGADAGGDFLDQISEYSAQFQAAGLDARSLLNILDTSVKQGVFSDKGADVIKETGLRLREMTTATQDALKPLGELTNQQIRTAVATGDTFEAIKLVSAGIKDTSLSAQEVQTIIADVFGGPGEDAGFRFLDLIEDIDQGFKLTSESASEFQKAQLALLEAEQELSKTQVELGETLSGAAGGYKTLGLNIQNFALKFLLVLIDVFTPVKDAFTEIFESIGELIDQLGLLSGEGEETISFFDALKQILTITTLPLRFFLQLVNFVIDSIKELAGSSDSLVSGFFDEIINGFKIIQLVLENTPYLFAGFFEAAKAAILGFKDLVVDTFTNVKDIIVGALTFDADQLTRGVENLKKPFNKFGNDVQEAFIKGFSEARKKGLEKNQKELEKSNEVTLRTQRKFADKLTKEQLEAAKRRAEAIRKATFELNKFRIEQEIKQLEEIAANEDLILASRLKAINDAADKRIDLAMLERDELLRNEELTAAGRLLIIEQFQAKLAEIEKDAKKAIEITIDLDTKKTEDELRALLDTTLEQRLSETNTALANELTALNESFANQEISLIDFEQRKLDIERRFNQQRLEDQLSFFQNQLQLLNLSKDERIKIEEQIANTRLALAEQSNENLIEKEQALQDALRDLKQTTFDSALTIIENLNEAEDMKRERDLEKLEEQKEKELEAAGDNEERKAAIEAKYAAERQKIEAEQAKADRKRAIFEKALAATQIAVQTALAIIKAVSASPLTGGLPFSAIVAAIGAVQLAAVLSKPIPQFWKGTSFSPEGWAIVNELGPEMMETPDGKKHMIYTDGPTLTYLERGTRIHDAETTKDLITAGSIQKMNHSFNRDAESIRIVHEGNDVKMELKKGFSMLNHSIQNQRRPIINLNKNDIQFMTEKGLNFIKYMNAKYPD